MVKECVMGGEVLSFVGPSLYSQVIKDPSLFIHFLCLFTNYDNKGLILSIFECIISYRSLYSMTHTAHSFLRKLTGPPSHPQRHGIHRSAAASSSLRN